MLYISSYYLLPDIVVMPCCKVYVKDIKSRLAIASAASRAGHISLAPQNASERLLLMSRALAVAGVQLGLGLHVVGAGTFGN